MKKIIFLLLVSASIISCSTDESNDLQEPVNQEFTGKDQFYLNGKLQSVSFEDAKPNTYELVIQGDQRIDAFSSIEELAKSNFDKKIYEQFLIINSSTTQNTVEKYKTIEELESEFPKQASVNSKSADIFDHPLGIPNHTDKLVFHYIRDTHSWLSIPLITSSDTKLDINAVYESTGRKDFYNQSTGYLFNRDHVIKNHTGATRYLYLRRASDNTWFFQTFPSGLEVSNLVNFDVSQIYVF
jgi:hypothetical protein